MACVIPDIFALPLAWRYVPESPGWLIVRGRHKEVEELIEDVAIANTGATDCLLQGGRIRKLIERPHKGDDDWASLFDEIAALFDPKLRQITMFLIIVWAACCFTYYGCVCV